MEINKLKKFTKKVSIVSALVILMIILFCSFTISQYFFKIKLGEVKESTELIIKHLQDNNQSIEETISRYPIYNSILQGYNNSGKIIISKSNFTKQLDYQNITIDKIDTALDPYKVSVLNGNTISGVIKLSDIKGDIMIVGLPYRDSNNTIIGAIFVLKLAQEYNSVIIGLNVVLAISMIFILISIIIPFYFIAKKYLLK